MFCLHTGDHAADVDDDVAVRLSERGGRGRGFGRGSDTLRKLIGDNRTDARGEFVIKNVPLGEQRFVAEKKRYRSATSAEFDLEPGLEPRGIRPQTSHLRAAVAIDHGTVSTPWV